MELEAGLGEISLPPDSRSMTQTTLSSTAPSKFWRDDYPKDQAGTETALREARVAVKPLV
jgi:hypothetical protein